MSGAPAGPAVPGGRTGGLDPAWWALAFLTRVPVRRHPSSAADLARAVPWFPMVGAAVGAVVGVVYAGLWYLLPPLAAAATAVAVGALLTGGFHEDGLADSLDALAGGTTPQRRLEILKDSRHGTFGVLALVLSTLLRVSLLAALGPAAGVAASVAAHALGRGTAVAVMGAAPAVTHDGLGAAYLTSLQRRQVLVGVIASATIGLAMLGPWVAAALPACAAGALVVVRWANARVGGVSGDTLGATEQVAEVLVLAVVAATVGSSSGAVIPPFG